jgi:hypothetical protein
VRLGKRGLLGALTAALAASPARAEETYLLLVTGLSGEPKYADAFHQWAGGMMDAAQRRFGLPRSHIVYLAEDPARDPERISDKATRQNLGRVLADWRTQTGAGDRIFIVFFGHGSAEGGEARLNLPGPDLTATELDLMLDDFKTEELVVVNTASASGGFLPALSGKRRTIVTATKTGMERNETVFGQYFSEAFTADGADVDKDNQISVFEAFNYARAQVARFYEQANRLQTEHAILDDNGDGQGVAIPDARSADGALARRAVLRGGLGGLSPAGGRAEDPEVAALYQQKRQLEERIENLKEQKDAMPAEVYEKELEDLMVELALKNRAIREIEGKKER